MAERLSNGSLHTEPTERQDIDGFVLAGGASRRMGKDKSQLILGGATLLMLSVSALGLTCGSVRVVGSPAQNADGIPAIPDEYVLGSETVRGSIVGLYSALKNADTEWIAVLACDMPFISGEFFERLVSFIGDDTDAVVPVQPDGRLQPLCALYRSDACLPVVEEMLKTGEWKLQNLFGRVRIRKVNFGEFSDLEKSELFFLNVNTPEEYENAKAIFRARPDRNQGRTRGMSPESLT